MIVLTMEQGTPAWEQARIGLPTSSRFDEILTPAKLQYSKGSWKYRNQILAEWLMGYAIDWGGSSQFMERGTEMEPRAREWYEITRGVDVAQVGFVVRDDGRVGCSPDGLVGDDGGTEIKCPALHTMIGYMEDPTSLAAAYRGQVQGSLWLTGRAWWDVIAYSPVLPPVVVRVEPDAEYHDALGGAIEQFLADLDAAKAKLAEHRQPILVGGQTRLCPMPGEEMEYLAALEGRKIAA